MGGATGRLPGRDVKRDLAMYVYIYLLFVPFRLYGNNFDGTFFIPSRQSGIPAKAGQFLSYKHSVPLCRDNIMLTLQIVPGEIVPGEIETFSCKPEMKSVSSRETARPALHINSF